MPRKNYRTKPTTSRPALLPSRCVKRAYPSAAFAERAATTSMLAQPHVELSWYQCDICRKWHLTSR